MEMLLTIISLLTTLAIFLHFRSSKTRAAANLPPGPPRLPIIGNLHNLGDQPHQSLTDLAKIHGPIMSLKLGQLTTIVVSSPTLAKQILQKHDQRQDNLSIRAHDHHEHGLPWVPIGPKWRNLRKICNTYLFTTQKLDSNKELRGKKIQELLEGVRQNAYEGKAVNIGKVAFKTTFSALSTTVLSLDMTDEGSSEDAREFEEVARSIMAEAGKANLGDYFPLLGKLDLKGIHRQMRTLFGKVFVLFARVIDQRFESRKSKEYVTCTDMLDTLLDIVDQENAEASMDLDLIKHLFLDLFVAGTDTTSSTLEWAMVELLRNPNTFAKAREELDRVIGRDNHLQESDILRLPYQQAIIKETFRLHPSVPLLPRKAGFDVEVSGFTVPKGAQILVNAWAIGRDPATWGNPNSFMPERFMESEVDYRGNSFELIPFGGGRRICPGLPLAMRMLHMMLGSLVHWFDWKLKDGVEPESLDMEEKFGISLQKAKPLLAVPVLATR